MATQHAGASSSGVTAVDGAGVADVPAGFSERHALVDREASGLPPRSRPLPPFLAPRTVLDVQSLFERAVPSAGYDGALRQLGFPVPASAPPMGSPH